MSTWLLLVGLFVVWLLACAAAVSAKAVDGARRGLPVGHRGGVSIAPIIPIMPLGMWGLALLVDVRAAPWGTMVVGGFHAVLGLVCVVSIVRDVRRLRVLDGPSRPPG